MPWYSSERDAYTAVFTVSLFVHNSQQPGSGVSRRVLFNSSDALKDPVYANDGKVVRRERSASDVERASGLHAEIRKKNSEATSKSSAGAISSPTLRPTAATLDEKSQLKYHRVSPESP